MLSAAQVSIPDINLFYGSFTQSDSYGSVSVTGRGDAADIVFYDRHNEQSTRGSIKLYALNKMKKNVFFYHCMEGKDETLLHTWGTKHVDKAIVKYSEQCPIAFVFSCDGDVENYFNKLFSVSEFLLLDYFKEVQFCEQLQKIAGITLAELRNTEGFTDERIRLLCEHNSNLKELLKCGVTIKQLAVLNDSIFNLLITNNEAIKKIFKMGLSLEQLEAVSLTKLMNCLDNSRELQEALKLVTIKQILGIDHVPKQLNVSVSKQNKLSTTSSSVFSGGSSGNYSYKHDDSKLIITDMRNQSTFQVTFGMFQEGQLSIFNQAILESATSIDLVHKWYIVTSEMRNNGKKHNIFYCPEIKSMHQELIDVAFSEEEFRNCAQYMLLRTVYYKEEKFTNSLNSLGYSIAELKNLPGMSLDKLELFYQNSYALECFLKIGIDFSDLAKVSCNRLHYLFNNRDAVDCALKFVDKKELLGLNKAGKMSENGFFAEATTQLPDEQEDYTSKWSCFIM